jgi:hypothetical protein
VVIDCGIRSDFVRELKRDFFPGRRGEIRFDTHPSRWRRGCEIVEITGKVVQEIVGGTGDGEADAVKAELHDILHRYANRSTLHVNLHLEAK